MAIKFNLSKVSTKKAEIISEKRINELNKEMKNEAIDDSGSYEYRLKDGRKHPEGDATYQKLLQEKRINSSSQGITEFELNAKSKTINDMKVRNDETNNTPLMDYSKEAENKCADKFSKENKRDKRDTSFWDDNVGQQMIGETTKIVANDQSSQLVSNYNSRKEFNKKMKMAETTLKTLKDADAMLYSLYRKSADEHRELTNTEKQIITDVNSGKIRVLSQFKPSGEFSEEMLDQDMKAEELDSVAEEIAGIQEALESSMEEDVIAVAPTEI